MSRVTLQKLLRLKAFPVPIACTGNLPKILPTEHKPRAPFQDPIKREMVISLPGAISTNLIYSAPQPLPLPSLPNAFNTPFSDTWLNFDFDIDIQDEVDKPLPPSIRPNKEVIDPDLEQSQTIQCKMHQGRNVKRLRRIRMRRHRYVKWLKRMRFKLRKIRFEREKKKAKVFQDQLDTVQKSAENFDPEGYIRSQVDLARKGGYHYDVQSDLKKFLTLSNEDKK